MTRPRVRITRVGCRETGRMSAGLPVYFQVGTNGPVSTTWTLWAHETSIYVANRALGALKVSLHGLDQRHPSGGHFRVDLNVKGRKPEGVALIDPRQGWPLRFDGTHTDLGYFAVRIRVTDIACALERPAVRAQKKRIAVAALPVPPDDWAADLDLTFQQIPRSFEPVSTFSRHVTISSRGAYLQIGLYAPGEAAGFRLHNEKGVVLRSETRMRRLDLYPTPSELAATLGGDGPLERTMSIGVDDAGILWIVEDAARRQVLSS